MMTRVEVGKILSDYIDKLHEGVTEDDILEYWNVIVTLADTCLAETARADKAEKALARIRKELSQSECWAESRIEKGKCVYPGGVVCSLSRMGE